MVTGALVTPGYFRTLGIPLLRGRDLAASDRLHTPRVMVVSETFAARFWPGEEALGRRIHLGDDWWTVVGIVRDVKQTRLYDAPEPQFYRPHAQQPWEALTVAVRVAPHLDVVTSAERTRLLADIRRAVQAVDPRLPRPNLTAMPDILAGSLAAQRLYGTLFATFAGAALLLATAGLYGVMAYYVARRTSEIGVRMALGADRARVVRLVMRQGAAVVGLGLLLGTLGAAGVARTLAATLHGVRAGEPLVYLGAVVVLAVAAAGALYAPARRASGVEPSRALRAE
jgi:predicted permease